MARSITDGGTHFAGPLWVGDAGPGNPLLVIDAKAAGAMGDGTTDDTEAIQAAITAAVDRGGGVYFPPGFYRLTSHIGLANSVTLFGGGMFSTVLTRAFSGASDADGLFNITAGADVTFADMAIMSAAGTSGGCLISAIANSSSAPTPMLRNVDLTSESSNTHAYTLYFDGSLKATGAVGIRTASLENVLIFGASTAAALFKSVISLHWQGGGSFQAGGTSGAVSLTGTAGVPSDLVAMDVTSIAALSLDHVANFNIQAATCGAVTNTANTTAGMVTAGNLTSVQSNWTNSGAFGGNQKLTLRSGRITLDPTNLAGALLIDGTSVGNVAVGIRQDASTAKINFVGAHGAGFAVADNATFTFTIAPTGVMFSVAASNGKAGLFYATNASATITILSDPSSFFENSATPTAGKLGVFKSAAASVVSVINKVGSSVTLSALCFGGVSANTDPA